MKYKDPIKKAKGEADRALQDAHRRNYPNALCESCGRRSYCVHHHIPKGRSSAGRYEEKNLIFICPRCHNEISFNGGSQVVARYTIKRGSEWVADMEKLEKVKRSPYSLKELLIEKEKWINWKIKKKEQVSPF